jgi:hypothetical protein
LVVLSVVKKTFIVALSKSFAKYLRNTLSKVMKKYKCNSNFDIQIISFSFVCIYFKFQTKIGVGRLEKERSQPKRGRACFLCVTKIVIENKNHNSVFKIETALIDS